MDLKPYPSMFDMGFECCVLCFFFVYFVLKLKY